MTGAKWKKLTPKSIRTLKPGDSIFFRRVPEHDFDLLVATPYAYLGTQKQFEESVAKAAVSLYKGAKDVFGGESLDELARDIEAVLEVDAADTESAQRHEFMIIHVNESDGTAQFTGSLSICESDLTDKKAKLFENLEFRLMNEADAGYKYIVAHKRGYTIPA